MCVAYTRISNIISNGEGRINSLKINVERGVDPKSCVLGGGVQNFRFCLL